MNDIDDVKGKRVLMIVTSHAALGTTGTKTGFWLEELAAPYYELADAGALLDIASPLGGKPAADPKSETAEAASVKRFLADPIATGKLAATKTLEDASRERYDAYFVVGGHGVMWDLATNDVLAQLLGTASFAVRDGMLITGQNPASSAAVAKLVIEALGSTSP